MKKEFKIPKIIGQKWVDALRSGEYIQGKTTLCMTNDDDNENTYCCLGVAAKCMGYTDQELVKHDLLSSMDESLLGESLANQMLNLDAGDINRSAEDILTILNDGCQLFPLLQKRFNLGDSQSLTFLEIADFIEQHFEFIGD
jgi:hypothetical protein